MKQYNNEAINRKDSFFLSVLSVRNNGGVIYCNKVTEFTFPLILKERYLLIVQLSPKCPS